MKKTVTVKNKKRIAIGFVLLSLLLVALTFRVGWHQIVNANELTDKAVEQQTRDVPIAAKRGTIYDRNGKELASSITCYSVWARPAQLTSKKDESQIQEIASSIAEITGDKAEDVKEKITKKQALVKIAKYLDKETADKIRALELDGLEISEDTRKH